MILFKNIVRNRNGMAMVIVLTVCFVVIVTISVGAALVANNLDKAAAGSGMQKALANAQSALERVRGLHEANGHVYDACTDGDCINTSNGGCGPCSDLIYSNGDNRHLVRIQTIVQPNVAGEDVQPGSLIVNATGYYRNIIKQKSANICLDYCSAGGYTCDVDGCGGVCGTCSFGQTCVNRVCTNPTGCGDPSVECSDSCVEGEACGGGTVVDSANNIVMVGGGCQDESGSGCNQGGEDAVIRRWDDSGGMFEATGATYPKEGLLNVAILKGIDINRFGAAKFCEDLDVPGTYGNFNDWYLLAADEVNMSTIRDNNWAAGFADDCYWASTEKDSDNALYINMTTMIACADNNKGNNFRVRCLRRY